MVVALLAAGGAIGLLALRASKLSAGVQTAANAGTSARLTPLPPRAPDSQTVRPGITISVRASPAGASLVLDGKPVSNPFRLQRPAGAGTAELTVTAPGYQAQELRLPLSSGGEWNVELVPAVKRPVVKRPPHKGPRRPSDKKKDEGYLDNPYRE